MLLGHDAFFTQLTKLFENTREKGSVFLSQKRCKMTISAFLLQELIQDAYEENEKSKTDKDTIMDLSEDSKDYPCLIRATDGRDIKISTLVQPSEQDRFLTEYGNILKVHMDTLKKKDRKKKIVGKKSGKKPAKDPAKKTKSAA